MKIRSTSDEYENFLVVVRYKWLLSRLGLLDNGGVVEIEVGSGVVTNSRNNRHEDAGD